MGDETGRKDLSRGQRLKYDGKEVRFHHRDGDGTMTVVGADMRKITGVTDEEIEVLPEEHENDGGGW